MRRSPPTGPGSTPGSERRTASSTGSAGPTRSRRGGTAAWPAGCTASPIGGLFAGESMFHHRRDASKVALVGLVDRLTDAHAARRLIDVQWATPHLESLGAEEISRREYVEGLPDLLSVPLPDVFARLAGGGQSRPAAGGDQ